MPRRSGRPARPRRTLRPRRTTSLVRLAVPLLLVTGVTAACGDAVNVESGMVSRGEAYTLSGDAGTTPDVEWKAQMEAGDAKTEVVSTGDGAKLKADDEVLVNYWVGNGYTNTTSLDTYDADQLPATFPVGGQPAQPTSQEPTEAEVARYYLDGFVSTQIEAGDTVGTRKTVTVSSADVLGYAGGSVGIGNDDGLLFVIDIASPVLDKPEGEAQPRSPQLPKINLAKSKPASLDFSKTPAPDGKLHVTTLVEGTGPEVKKDDYLFVNYLGQVYDAAEPFDESFSRGTPFNTTIGQGQVIKGWDQGLVGVPVGSRVLLEVPPALGYGKKGSSNIPGGSTLYFVIDVLAAG